MTNVVAVMCFTNLFGMDYIIIACLIGDDASASVNIYTNIYFYFYFYMFEWCSLLCVVRMGTSIDGRKPFWLPLHVFSL